MKEHKIEQQCQELLEEFETKANDKLNEISREITNELKFTTNFAEDTTLKMSDIFDGKKLWDWSSVIVGGGLSIAAGIAYIIGAASAGPLGWAALAVAGIGILGSFLFKSRDKKEYEARTRLEKNLRENVSKICDSLQTQIDKDKAGEMILVVNKMERAADGNSAYQQNIIREDLRKVVSPYTPEQLHLSFLDAESYLDSVAEHDVEIAYELVERSGYNEFVETLNQFVAEKSITSKLTTELYEIDEQLEKAIKELQPKSTDSDIDALEESYMQQRHLLIETRGRMQQEVKDIYTSAASKIRNIGLDAANLLVEGCKQDEVEEELRQSIRQADDIIEKCQAEAIEIIDARLNEMGQHLEVIENSEFSRTLKSRLSGKFDGLPEGIKKVLTNAGPGFQKAGQAVLNNAYKAGTQGGLKLTNFSGSTIHQMVLKVGHNIGYNFKPWQAIKLTKGIAIGGQVLSALGVVFTAFMQIKNDQDEERIRADLKNNRQNIRSQFNAAANELEDFARQFIRNSINTPLGKSIATIDETIQEIRDTRSNRSLACKNMEGLQEECKLLIRDIHSET